MRQLISRHIARWRREESGAHLGQATVEFAIVSVAFLLIVFGTVDFGRAIYLNAQLENAVRDVAREGKVGAGNGQGVNISALESHVYNYWFADDPNRYDPERRKEGTRPGLKNADVTVTCAPDPKCVSGETLTVSAELPFQAVTQQFLGLSPITLRASASVVLE